MGEVLGFPGIRFRRGMETGGERVGLGSEEMGFLHSGSTGKHCRSWVSNGFSIRSWRRVSLLVLGIPNARMH